MLIWHWSGAPAHPWQVRRSEEWGLVSLLPRDSPSSSPSWPPRWLPRWLPFPLQSHHRAAGHVGLVNIKLTHQSKHRLGSSCAWFVTSFYPRAERGHMVVERGSPPLGLQPSYTRFRVVYEATSSFHCNPEDPLPTLGSQGDAAFQEWDKLFLLFSRASLSFLRKQFDPNISVQVKLFCPRVLSFLSGLHKASDRLFSVSFIHTLACCSYLLDGCTSSLWGKKTVKRATQ